MSVLQNIILGLSIAIPVGPSSIITINNGFKYGFRSAIITSLGIIAADTLCLLIVYFGLSNFVITAPMKFILLIVGACILIHIAVQDSKVMKSNIHQSSKKKKKYTESFTNGFFINFSNPMAVVFWLGIYGSLLTTDNTSSANSNTLLLSMAIILGIFLWQLVLSSLSHWGIKYVKEKVFRLLFPVANIILVLYGFNFAYKAILIAIE